jgi:glucosylceramidase
MRRTDLRRCRACAWLALALAWPLAAQQVRVVVSSSAGDRLKEQPELRFVNDSAGALPANAVDDSRTFQKMDGFGATFNEAGLISLNQLPAAEQERVLKTLFDPSEGAGYTLMKSPLAGCDFASAGPMYSYDDTPWNTGLARFKIARDLEPAGLITFIRRARRYGQFLLQSTTDYPPDWMLDEKMNLRCEHYDTFARYLVRYVQEYAKEGVTIDYLAPLNEPQEIYCKITYQQIRELLRDHIGPRFREARLTTRIQVSDANNRAIGLQHFPTVLNDPEARKHISTMPVHGYQWDRDTSAPMTRLHEMYPDLPVWQTEVCHIRRTTLDKRNVPVFDFEDGDWWGRMLVDDMRNWASGWIYWNMIPDQNGEPWLVDLKHRNPEINHQQPVSIIDTVNRKAVFTGLYYYLAHFSKYVRPGAVRVEARGGAPGLSLVAFRDAGRRKILQLVNSAKNSAEFVLVYAGKTARAGLPAISIGTFIRE